MDYDLGHFDDETCRLEPIENPFGSKVLPVSPECTVTYVTGMDLKGLAPQAGFGTSNPPVNRRTKRR